MPLPGYGEIRVARDPWRIARMLEALEPDTVHIATEGPLGLAARSCLVRRGLPFTTSLHTKFPEYVAARTGLPVAIGYRFLRWFHGAAAHTLCTTVSHRDELARAGLGNLRVWGRGVDTVTFIPDPQRCAGGRLRLLYVGRVAVEKNLEAFLALDIDAEKRVVGDGPQRRELEERYPDAVFTGYRTGSALVDEYAAADVFVFPSRTDTFGLVMLEAMACGTPVAAYPVTGPRDVIESEVNGFTSECLLEAVVRASSVDRMQCRLFALQHGWDAIARRFVASLVAVASDQHPGRFVERPI
jgi:glycosyltransferase involved in cell wall biosynthesis